MALSSSCLVPPSASSPHDSTHLPPTLPLLRPKPSLARHRSKHSFAQQGADNSTGAVGIALSAWNGALTANYRFKLTPPSQTHPLRPPRIAA
jgi:hypothetical protein